MIGDLEPNETQAIEGPREGGLSVSANADRTAIEEKIVNATGIAPEEAHRAVEITQESLFAGPIPSPEAIAQYESVESGLGVEIVRDHLAQRQHLRECDTRWLHIAESDSRRKDGWLAYAGKGQLFGFLSLVVFVAAAVGLVLLRQPWIAGLCLAAPAVGVVVQFIKGREVRTEVSEDDAE